MEVLVHYTSNLDAFQVSDINQDYVGTVAWRRDAWRRLSARGTQLFEGKVGHLTLREALLTLLQARYPWVRSLAEVEDGEAGEWRWHLGQSPGPVESPPERRGASGSAALAKAGGAARPTSGGRKRLSPSPTGTTSASPRSL